jgi:hypothetical protein
MIECAFSVLQVRVRITTDCVELRDHLEAIRVKMEPDRPSLRLLHLQVQKEGGQFVVREGTEIRMTCPDPEWTTVFLHQWINRCICDDMEGLMIHGGSGTFRGKRFILCGPKGAGKTTLLCRLIFDGVQVHSDETVFLTDGEAVPFPGKFHLKEGSIPLVPELGPVGLRLKPYSVLSGDGRFFFFDPSDAGFEWTAPRAKVDAFFYLEPQHSGEAGVGRCPKFIMVGKILGQTLNLAGDPRHQIRQLCRTVDGGLCLDLTINDPTQGARMIRDVLCSLS